MSKVAKTLDRIVRGISDANLRFVDLRAVLLRLGFAERVRGDHHLFTREGMSEILNLQPRGGQAKAFQVRQVRAVIVAQGLAGALDDEAPDDGPRGDGSERSTLEGTSGDT